MAKQNFRGQESSESAVATVDPATATGNPLRVQIPSSEAAPAVSQVPPELPVKVRAARKPRIGDWVWLWPHREPGREPRYKDGVQISAGSPPGIAVPVPAQIITIHIGGKHDGSVGLNEHTANSVQYVSFVEYTETQEVGKWSFVPEA